MPNSSLARRRFVAAVALYLAWVGVLAVMAITSSYRPPATLIPTSTGSAPADGATHPAP